MENRQTPFMQCYYAVAAFAGWTGLGLLFIDMTSGKHGAELASSIINYFSYFTILSNILVALTFTCCWLWPQSSLGELLFRPAVRAGAAIYITVTGVVYALLLSNLGGRSLGPLVGTVLLHYVVPVLYVFDWLFLAPKGGLGHKSVLSWLAFPLAYAVYTLIHGAVSGFYPYHFVTVPKLGYPRVLLNCLFLLITFIVLGLLVIAWDRMRGRSVQGQVHDEAHADLRSH